MKTYERCLADGDLDESVVAQALSELGMSATITASSPMEDRLLGVDNGASVSGSTLRVQTKKRDRKYGDVCLEWFHAQPARAGQPVVKRSFYPDGWSLCAYKGAHNWDLLLYGFPGGEIMAVTIEEHNMAWAAAAPVREQAMAFLAKGHPRKSRTPLANKSFLVRGSTPRSSGTAPFCTYNIAIPWSRIGHRVVRVG